MGGAPVLPARRNQTDRLTRQGEHKGPLWGVTVYKREDEEEAYAFLIPCAPPFVSVFSLPL